MKITRLIYLFFLFSVVTSAMAIEKIPFRFERGAIIVEVKINSKFYSFYLSSASYSQISQSLIQELNLKINSSNNSFEDKAVYQVDKLSIENLEFDKTDFIAITNSSQSQFACKNISGVIGVNIMSRGIWRIDFKNQEIYYSEKIKDFNFLENVKRTSFEDKNIRKIPFVSVQVDDKIFSNIAVNTGYNGTIDIKLEHKINFPFEKFKNVKYLGLTYWKSIDVSNYIEYCTIIPKVSLNNIDLGATMIPFNNYGRNQIGTKVLSNFIITIDWKNNKIYFENYPEIQPYKIEDYGFYFDKINNAFQVIGIYENSDAMQNGVRLGDIVLKINDIDLMSLSKEEFCDLYFNFKNYFNNKDINVTIMRDNKISVINVSKKTIIE